MALVLLLFVSLVFGLLLFVFLGTFSRLLADDFCYFANAKQLGILNGLVRIYTTWSGRFSTVSLIMVLEPLNKYIAQSFPGVIILAWLISLIALVVTVFEKIFGNIPRSLAWVFAALVLFLTCLIVPNRFQVLYWLNGSITYTIPLLTLTALMYWALKLFWRSSSPHPLTLALFCVLIFISGGFSETTAVLQFTVFLLSFVYSIFRQLPRRTRFVFGLAAGFSLLSILVFLISPGNHIRQALFPAPPGLFELVWLSIRYGLAFIFHTLIAYPVPFLFSIIVSMILAFLIMMTQPENDSHNRTCSRSLGFAGGFIALGTVILIISTCVPSVYAQSAYPEARALIPGTYILILGVSSLSFLSGIGLFSNGTFTRWSKGKTFHYFLVTGLILACVYPLRAGNSLNPEFKQAKKYASAWDTRSELVASSFSRGENRLELKAINSQYGISELETDPGFWVNKCFSNYYQLVEVTAK
jgi:hypothetical protein